MSVSRYFTLIAAVCFLFLTGCITPDDHVDPDEEKGLKESVSMDYIAKGGRQYCGQLIYEQLADSEKGKFIPRKDFIRFHDKKAIREGMCNNCRKVLLKSGKTKTICLGHKELSRKNN